MTDYQSSIIYLFVINFHWPTYDTVPYFDNDLLPAFSQFYSFDFDVIYMGPEHNAEYHVLSTESSIGGWYSYHSIKVALDLFPPPPQGGYKYAGYFYVNDDSCLQPTLLGRLNHGIAMRETTFPSYKYAAKTWNHSNMYGKWFLDAARSAISEISRDKLLSAQCKLDEDYILGGWSDFFYFPKKDIQLFLKLERIFWREKVYLESAVHAMMRCLHATVIIDCNYDMHNSALCLHVHPMKFSIPLNKKICLNRVHNKSLTEVPTRISKRVLIVVSDRTLLEA